MKKTFIEYFLVKILFTTVVLKAAIQPSSALASPALRCDSLFTSSELSQALTPPTPWLQTQTVYPVASEKGFIKLQKMDPQKPWTTSFNPYEQGFSNHGDPRSSIYVFGVELAANLGYSFKMDPATKVETLTIPNPNTLSQRVRKINEILVKRGQEPISYLPVEFGYATADQILHLSSRVSNGFDMFFPFASNDVKLTPHEASYHLSCLVLPKFVLNRAKTITKRTLEFIDLIKRESSISKEDKDAIISQLYKERAIELDFGTGNTSARLTHFKRFFPERPFIEINKPSSDPQYEVVRGDLETSLAQMAHPYLTPSMAVVARVLHMTDTSATSISNLHQSGIDSFFVTRTYEGHGHKIHISDISRQSLVRLMTDFIGKHQAVDNQHFPLFSKDSFVTEVVKQLDEKIKNITRASRE